MVIKLKRQSGYFIQAKHKVHVLDCLPGGTFQKVVNGGDDDQRTCCRGMSDVDITIIGMGNMLHTVMVSRSLTNGAFL